MFEHRLMGLSRFRLLAKRGSVYLMCVLLESCSGCPPSGPAPGPFMYVGEFSNSSITAYLTGASGDTPPFKTYQGSNTLLSGPTGVWVDLSRNLYVANQSSNSVTEYALVDGGNVTPSATIQGRATGLNKPRAVAVASGPRQPGNGNIFVANFSGNSVTVYAPTGASDRAPIYTVTAGVSQPIGVAIIGIFLFVLNSNPPSITSYTGLGANGVGPLATITSSQIQNPQGLGTDGLGWLYVSNFDANSIAVFLGFVQGNVNTNPWTSIQGDASGLQGPEGIAFDGDGNLYVANRRGSSGFGSITVYPGFSPSGQGPNSTSSPQNLAPGQTLQGPSTQLAHIIGLGVG